MAVWPIREYPPASLFRPPDAVGGAVSYGLHKKIPQPKLRDFLYDPYGNRTHVTAVKGPCLNRLTNGP